MAHKKLPVRNVWSYAIRHKLGTATLGALVFVGAPLAAFAAQGVYNSDNTPMSAEASSNEQTSLDSTYNKSHAPDGHVDNSSDPDRQASTDVSLEVTTQDGQKHEVSARINGEQVPLSQSNSSTKRIHQSSGQSVVDITVEGQGGSSSYVHSSTSIEINGHSYSTGGNVTGDEGRHPKRR